MPTSIILPLRFACLPLALGMTLGGGCGPRLATRYEIKGSVTFQGRPVESGSVSFDPLAGQEAGAKPRGIGGGFAHIRQGRYDTAASGRGHTGGPHRVIVVGLADKSPVSSGQPADLASAPPLFEPYEFTIDLPVRSDRLDIKVPKH